MSKIPDKQPPRKEHPDRHDHRNERKMGLQQQVKQRMYAGTKSNGMTIAINAPKN